MGILFISHSSLDNGSAIKVRNWLKDNGWRDVFLDLDPEQGLAPGQRWQEELKQAGARCSGVLILISPHWVASPWCKVEFLLADHLGKKIFPLFVAPTPFDDLPIELRARFQIADISLPDQEAEGFERLAIGLKRAGLSPNNFEWPPPDEPDRPIYRGLQSLDEQDAAVFFGRDALITKGLDALRRMRDGAPERMFVILGASGAGKSSFLKAGLIARLKRDEEEFLVLPVIRPERAAVTGVRGLAASLSCDAALLNGPDDVAVALSMLRTPILERLKRYADHAGESRTIRPPTIIIPIDQAEELFTAENAEAGHSLELLADATRVDVNTILLVTIRSDSFEKFQNDPRLADISLFPFSLGAIPHGAFKEVIEGPARHARPPLTIEPLLTEQLLKDLATDDALPLLAFTLERLLYRHRGKKTLALTDYATELGGLQGAILAAVEEAFAKAQRDPSLPADRTRLEQLARAAFIPGLVQIDNAEGEPTRRVERIDALPGATHALVRHLIDERLLVSDRRTIDGVTVDTIEVAHEAILRQWPALRSWIYEERDALRALDAVRVAAREWRAHVDSGDRGEGWLAHRGGRLKETEELLAPAHFSGALGSAEREYLAACRERENAQLERERTEIEREKKTILRTRRLQRNIFILIGAAVTIVLASGFGIAELLKGIAARSSDALAHLSEQASADQNYEQAARYALSGLSGADWPIVGYSGARAVRALEVADLSSRRIAILRGHAGVVESAAYSPDGRRIVTASNDRTARVWDVATGTQVTVLRGHTRLIYAAAYSPDGRRIVTASQDKTVRIWDAATGAQIALLRGHHGLVISAAFSPDGRRIVTACEDKTAGIWDTATGTQLTVLRGHTAAVFSAAYSPDGTRVVTASEDQTARIWDAAAGTQVSVLRGHDGFVDDALYSPDGRRIVTASGDKTARIWDAATGAQLTVLRGHDDSVASASYSPDGKRIATASGDKTARIWDATSGTQLTVLRGHDDVIESAAFSPDGRRIVTAGGKTARIWDTVMGAQITVLRGHDDTVNSAAFSAGGKRIVTASYDKTARIWDAATGRQLTVLRGHDGYVESAAYSPDGRRIVTASNDKTARIWDAATGAQIILLRGHNAIVFSAVYSPDGRRIVTASGDKTARIWDAATGAQLTLLRGHDDVVESAAYSPDGRRILTASQDKTARIWDAATGAPITVLRGHDDSVATAAFSPDGRRIVTASGDKTARIWDAATGTQLTVLRGHEGVVDDAAYSPDGTRVVTASEDTTARIWDAATGTQLAVLRGHDGRVDSAVYSPDGTRIVTASEDKTARVWKTPRVETSWLSLPHKALIGRTCATLLVGGLDHLTSEELAAAPELDPALDADACQPPTFWMRIRELLIASR